MLEVTSLPLHRRTLSRQHHRILSLLRHLRTLSHPQPLPLSTPSLLLLHLLLPNLPLKTLLLRRKRHELKLLQPGNQVPRTLLNTSRLLTNPLPPRSPQNPYHLWRTSRSPIPCPTILISQTTRVPSTIEVGKVPEVERRRVLEEDKEGLMDLEGREDLVEEGVDQEKGTKYRK